jgi:hypothetical protein
MRLAAIALFMVLLCPVYAYSQGPAPSLSEPTQPKQEKAPADNKAAQPDQQKTDPPPIVVNVLPAQKSDHEAEEDRKERKEKAELDRRLVDLTGDLAWFTAALFAATAALVVATTALAYYAFKQSRDMKASIKAAQQSAIAAERAADIAEKAIELSESASLIVDNWGVEKWGSPQPAIGFQIVNAGRNVAEVLEIVCRAPSAQDLPPEPDYQGAPQSPCALVAAGSRKASNIIPTLTPEQIAAIEGGELSLFVYGKIKFKSVNFDTIWELGFAQRITWRRNNAGALIPEFNYPVNPGFNFLRQAANG